MHGEMAGVDVGEAVAIDSNSEGGGDEKSLGVGEHEEPFYSRLRQTCQFGVTQCLILESQCKIAHIHTLSFTIQADNKSFQMSNFMLLL